MPSFDQLIRGNKAYLAVTSLLGLAALVAGVVMLWSANGTAVAVLMGALVVLWVISTTHHAMLARAEPPVSTGAAVPPADSGRHAA